MEVEGGCRIKVTAGLGLSGPSEGVGLAPVPGQRDLLTQPGNSHLCCLWVAISSTCIDWQLDQGHRKGPGDPNHTGKSGQLSTWAGRREVREGEWELPSGVAARVEW